MKDIKVELAKKNNNQDISEIFELLNNQYYHYSDMKDIDNYIQKKQCYVAIKDNKVIGAMVLKLEEQSYELVLIASKQKGSGKAMIDYAVQKCIDMNVSKLWCWSLKLYNAKDFYIKMGFTESFLLHKQWYGQDCYFFGRIVNQS